MKQMVRFFLPMIAVLTVSGCKPATQVTFDISTDVPCERVSGITITVGLEGTTEKGAPEPVKPQCMANGMVGAIGTYAVAPKNGVATGAVKVALAVGGDIDVETDCTAAKSYLGCVVARRRVSFVTSRSLTVPIELYLRCKDVACDENSTCNRAGKCVSSKVDTAACDAQGICNDLETRPEAGLPCFNEKTGDALFCSGEASWCTLAVDGQRGCATAPPTGGVSFQCRTSTDCGTGSQCVSGTSGVIGRCVALTEVMPGDNVLCTIQQTPSPCPGGARYCTADAGAGLSACTEPPRRSDGGVWEGLPCPKNGELRCYGATPYCSQFNDEPRCVADAGAQCWYSSDCEAGNSCYAGLNTVYSNVCAPASTAENSVPLCNPALQSADCAAGTSCDGALYGNRVCRTPCPAGRGDCNGLLLDDCEVDVKTDTSHCGGCGDVCAPAGAVPICADGGCSFNACQSGFVDCDVQKVNGCETKPGAPCQPLGALCRDGVQSCEPLLCGYGYGTCLPGANKAAGAACGSLSGNACNATGDCLCPADAGVNTECGLDSICNPAHKCVRNRFWDTQSCAQAQGPDAGISGNELCVTHGFTKARAAYGYPWGDCAGAVASSSDARANAECRVWDSLRVRCLDWTGSTSCVCQPLNNGIYGISFREYGGPPDHVFETAEYWHSADGGFRFCGGNNPGFSIRTYCEF